MALPKASTIIMNREGDRVSPCLMPLDISKKPSGKPLIRMEILGMDINLKIRLIYCQANPNASNVLHRNLQSTISYAF